MTVRGIEATSLASAGVGAALLALGLRLDPSRTWFAYLEVWTFAVTICTGALLLLMVGHASKGSWMVVTRRPTEAVVSALPLCALLFVPIAFGLRSLYAWAAPEESVEPAVRALLAHRHRYMNPPFFLVRTAIYFAVFIAAGELLRRWSRENDDRPRAALVLRMRRLGGGALPVVGLALTWASFDWTMSLDTETASTIFGLYFFAGSFVGAVAVVTILLVLSRRVAGVGAAVTVEHSHALGRVLFAMVCFWAYMAFSQLLLVWIGDIPAEVEYYARRTAGTWSAVSALLVCGMFVAPFFALVGRESKRRPRVLAGIAAWVFVMHYVDVYWMVMPAHDGAGLRPHWLDVGAALFVGGVSCAWVTRSYLRRAPMPSHAPDLVDGLRYEAAP